METEIKKIYISDFDMFNDPNFSDAQFPIIFFEDKTYRIVEGVKGGVNAVEIPSVK